MAYAFLSNIPLSSREYLSIQLSSFPVLSVSSCTYLVKSLILLMLLAVLTSWSPFIMNTYTQLHLHMPRSWVFLIINSLTQTHLLMMMVLWQFAFFHIGIVNFFSCFSLAFYDYTSNLNYIWLMMTSRISCLHAMNFRPLILMMFSVCHFSNLDDTFISSDLFLFLNSCVTGNLATHL